MKISLKGMRNRAVAVACVLGLLLAALLLLATVSSKPVYYDVKAAAATYPALPPYFACSNPNLAIPRIPVRMEISALDPATGAPPTGPSRWSITFFDTVAGIPDSQFTTGYDRNCLCEVPNNFIQTISGGTPGLLALSLDLRYTGNGTCNGFSFGGLNTCIMPVGDYRFMAQVTNTISNTGGMAPGVLQVRGGGNGNGCDPGGSANFVIF